MVTRRVDRLPESPPGWPPANPAGPSPAPATPARLRSRLRRIVYRLGADAIPLCARGLAEDPDPDVRALCAEALGRLAATAPLQDPVPGHQDTLSRTD